MDEGVELRVILQMKIRDRIHVSWCYNSPMCVDEGVESQSISPAAREVLHVYIGVACCLALAPDKEGLSGRSTGLTCMATHLSSAHREYIASDAN